LLGGGVGRFFNPDPWGYYPKDVFDSSFRHLRLVFESISGSHHREDRIRGDGNLLLEI